VADGTLPGRGELIKDPFGLAGHSSKLRLSSDVNAEGSDSTVGVYDRAT
jgi:hypothetical protein